MISYLLPKEAWGILLNFDRLVKLSVLTFQLIIIIYKRSNFWYHHWRCTSNYRPLSYPFRSLLMIPVSCEEPGASGETK